VTRPITAGVTVLLYVDMRMRKEGLDLALRTASGSGQPGAGQPGLVLPGSGGPLGDDFATVWRPPSAGPVPAPGAPPTTTGAPPPW